MGTGSRKKGISKGRFFVKSFKSGSKLQKKSQMVLTDFIKFAYEEKKPEKALSSISSFIPIEDSLDLLYYSILLNSTYHLLLSINKDVLNYFKENYNIFYISELEKQWYFPWIVLSIIISRNREIRLVQREIREATIRTSFSIYENHSSYDSNQIFIKTIQEFLTEIYLSEYFSETGQINDKNPSVIYQLKDRNNIKMGFRDNYSLISFFRSLSNEFKKTSEKILNETINGNSLEVLLKDKNQFMGHLIKAFKKIFKEWGNDIGRIVTTDFVVVIPEQTGSPPDIKGNYYLYLQKSGSNYSTTLEKEKIKDIIGSEIPNYFDELINLSLGVYSADKYDIKTRLNARRSIVIKMFSNSKSTWEKHIELLQEALIDLLEENLQIEILEGKGENNNTISQQKPKSYDCICLLSGGVDSYCGAISLLKQGRNPLFVSINKGGYESTAQKNVKDFLESHFPSQGIFFSIKLRHHFHDVHFKKREASEGTLGSRPTQRSRSFVFLSIASIFLLGNDVEEIYIPENGIMSYIDLVPINSSYTWTRTTLPTYLEGLSNFFSRIYKKNVRIINPFLYKTKTEVLQTIIHESNLLEGLSKTYSCSNPRRAKRCMNCLPCFMRSIAFTLNDLNKFETRSNIHTKKQPGNFFRPDLSSNQMSKEFKTFLDFLRFAMLFQENVGIIIKKYPILNNIEILDLFSRFSHELIDLVNLLYNTKFDYYRYLRATMTSMETGGFSLFNYDKELVDKLITYFKSTIKSKSKNEILSIATLDITKELLVMPKESLMRFVKWTEKN